MSPVSLLPSRFGYDDVFDLLDVKDGKALCPAHKDTSPSLSASLAHDGRILLNCHAGCCAEDIMKSIGLSMSDLFPPNGKKREQTTARKEVERRTHLYPDYRKTIINYSDGSKTAFFEHYEKGLWTRGLNGHSQTLYNLDALKKPGIKFLSESEKDADRLNALGLNALSFGGCENWRPEYADILNGHDVVILAHNDDPGRRAADSAARDLIKAGCVVKVIPGDTWGSHKGADVADYLATFKDQEEAAAVFSIVVENTPLYEAPIHREASHTVNGITASDLMKKVFPEPRMAIPGILPEGLNLLAGKPKKGKSIFALNIGLDITLHGLALGKIPVEQGSVIYLALEDNERRLQGRLKQMLRGDKAPDNLHLYTKWPRMDAGGLELLEAKIKEIPNIRLVIIDTLQKFRKPQRGNGNLYADDYETVTQIKDLADRLGICILLIHHLRKSEADDIFDTLSGSLGLTGGTDGNLVMENSKGITTLHVTGRDVEAVELVIELDTQLLTWTLRGERTEIKNTHDQQKIYEVLKEASDALSPTEIAEIASLKVGNVKKVLAKFMEDGKVQSAPNMEDIPRQEERVNSGYDGYDRYYGYFGYDGYDQRKQGSKVSRE